MRPGPCFSLPRNGSIFEDMGGTSLSFGRPRTAPPGVFSKKVHSSPFFLQKKSIGPLFFFQKSPLRSICTLKWVLSPVFDLSVEFTLINLIEFWHRNSWTFLWQKIPLISLELIIHFVIHKYFDSITGVDTFYIGWMKRMSWRGGYESFDPQFWV